VAKREKDILGERGEAAALAEIERAGYKILDLNWMAATSGGGELDIVALDGDVLVFIEVKTRTDDEMGSPLEAITRSKRRKIARAASAYLMENRVEDRDCRFDVVGVTFDAGRPVCEVVRDAFVLGEERWSP